MRALGICFGSANLNWVLLLLKKNGPNSNRLMGICALLAGGCLLVSFLGE